MHAPIRGWFRVGAWLFGQEDGAGAELITRRGAAGGGGERMWEYHRGVWRVRILVRVRDRPGARWR